MSKLSKLILTPRLFFDDMLIKRGFKKRKPSGKKPVIKKVVSARTVSKPKTNTNTNMSIPSWFTTATDYKDSDFNAPVFMYLPWIEGHGDALIKKIRNSNDFNVLALPFISDVTDNEQRRSVLRFARQYPDIYRKLVIKALLPYKNKIDGFIFTFDWAPIMRIIVDVCRDFNIPTILIPHESVFADRQMYYKDPTALASTPKVDIVLSWGALQTDIFVERGYPQTRILPVGAPKFDTYKNYVPLLNRQQFCKIFNLSEDKEIILFAAQPLDSQFDTRVARETQRQAIQDLYEYADENNMQLIVRMPPSKDQILNREIIQKFEKSSIVAIDDAHYYLVPPEEAIYHSKYVTSINSTMLFEAKLMNKFVFSMKYVEFDQIWQKAGIPAVKNKDELIKLVAEMEIGYWKPSDEGMQWAANQFGIGEFDGLASNRIKTELANVSNNYRNGKFSFYPTSLQRFLAKEHLDIVGVTNSSTDFEKLQIYFPALVQSNTILNTSELNFNIRHLASVELFCQWGIKLTNNDEKQRLLANRLGKSTVIVDEGFIQQVDSGLSGAPILSVIVDDLTSHYDASKPSRLEKYLVSNKELTEEQKMFAKNMIDKILQSKISKYNHAKSWPISIGRDGVKKILLIDQRYGDQSVASALADEHTFENMLHDALVNNPEADIIIKQHPDAIKRGKSSYYSNDKIQGYLDLYKNIYPVNIDINPYSILDVIDEVYVVSSVMGFEALMAGKKVRCYGVPFYAGWGLTQDEIKLDRRNRKRSFEDIFYYAYIKLSRYYNPNLRKVVDIENIIELISNNKK